MARKFLEFNPQDLVKTAEAFSSRVTHDFELLEAVGEALPQESELLQLTWHRQYPYYQMSHLVKSYALKAPFLRNFLLVQR